MKYLIRLCRFALMGAVLTVLSPFTIAQESQYSTGLELVDPDTYDQFPKTPKYRAVLPIKTQPL